MILKNYSPPKLYGQIDSYWLMLASETRTNNLDPVSITEQRQMEEEIPPFIHLNNWTLYLSHWGINFFKAKHKTFKSKMEVHFF